MTLNEWHRRRERIILAAIFSICTIRHITFIIAFVNNQAYIQVRLYILKIFRAPNWLSWIKGTNLLVSVMLLLLCTSFFFITRTKWCLVYNIQIWIQNRLVMKHYQLQWFQKSTKKKKIFHCVIIVENHLLIIQI